LAYWPIAGGAVVPQHKDFARLTIDLQQLSLT
jgi:hypothetical protein